MDLLRSEHFTVASFGPGAAYAGWLLRQLGAPVDHQTALDPEGLGAFLGQGASFVVEPVLRPARTGTFVTDAPVTAANRRLLEAAAEDSRVIWLTPWGLDNAWSEYPASNLALYAAGGWMSAVGHPEREPLAPSGSQAWFIAGAFAAIAALEHGAYGTPQRGLVDVSALESVTATMIYDYVAFQYYGRPRGRANERFSANQPLLTTLPCKDGYIGIHSALHNQWVALAALIGHPELVSDPRFASPLDRAANVAELDGYLLPWLAERTRWQVFHELQSHHIPCSAHPGMGEVLDSPHLRARDSWERVVTPSGRKLKVPGNPVRVIAESEPLAPASPGGSNPWALGAVRILDLSMGWAGPLVSHLMSGLGADVIKVESHNHIDWWRGSRPPGDSEGMGLHERSHVFNAVNRGKRGITLDLTTAKGRELVLELIASADIVMENYAAGVVEKLGLTYDVVRERNPGIIMLRQPGFGSFGPEASYVAFGNTIEGMSGLTSLTGYEDGPPTMLSNALGDPVSGLLATSAVLAALLARREDGRGRLLECAQLEGFLPLVAEGLISRQVTGIDPSRTGNRRPGNMPSGAYRCGDPDEWLVIEVESDEQWANLATHAGQAWMSNPKWSTGAERERDRHALDAAVAEWVRNAGREAVLATCRSAGVPSAPVNSEADVLVFEPLVEAGFWVGQEREPVGFHLYPAAAYSLRGSRHGSSLPAPLLGEHTEEVLAGLGLDEAARRRLREDGVTGSIAIAAAN